MFSRIKFYYNFYNLLSYFSKLTEYQIENENESEENENESEENDVLDNLLSNLEYYIFKVGFVGVKYTQMYISKIMYSNNKVKKKIANHFKNIFDNCPNHDDSESKKIFESEFNQVLETYIDIDTFEIFASGSIGQVYSAKTKNGEQIAIKVKHPNINNELEQFHSLINIIKIIQKIPFLKKRFNLYLDYDDFYNHLVQQVDFKNEVNNNKKFYELYKNNNYLIFPKVINYTNNIIVSSFERGVDFIDLSRYHKYQVATNFMCFIYNSALIENFIHGDLHIKNWKARKLNNNQYAMVIYDFGICFSVSDVHFSRNIWDSLEINNPEKLKKILKKSFNIEVTDEINKKLDAVVDNYSQNHKSVGYILDHVFEIMNLQDNILINKDLINILISVNFGETFVLEYLDISNVENGFMTNRINMISYCKTKNIYHELVKYLEECNKTKPNVSENCFFKNNFNLQLKPPE